MVTIEQISLWEPCSNSPMFLVVFLSSRFSGYGYNLPHDVHDSSLAIHNISDSSKPRGNWFAILWKLMRDLEMFKERAGKTMPSFTFILNPQKLTGNVTWYCRLRNLAERGNYLLNLVETATSHAFRRYIVPWWPWASPHWHYAVVNCEVCEYIFWLSEDDEKIWCPPWAGRPPSNLVLWCQHRIIHFHLSKKISLSAIFTGPIKKIKALCCNVREQWEVWYTISRGHLSWP